MSRSYRQPVYKAKQTQAERIYNKIFKARCRRITRGIKTMCDASEVTYPNINEVYDFWSFCDYKMNFIGCKTGTWQEDWVTRLKTKIV